MPICVIYVSHPKPDWEIELHLTGNMGRYMWSINGVKHADVEPLRWKLGEHLRITFVNDTMMNHPMHLHGMWSDLETGDNNFLPRKHTVIVQPGSRISYRVTVPGMPMGLPGMEGPRNDPYDVLTFQAWQQASGLFSSQPIGVAMRIKSTPSVFLILLFVSAIAGAHEPPPNARVFFIGIDDGAVVKSPFEVK
jgi:hypothetical protein